MWRKRVVPVPACVREDRLQRGSILRHNIEKLRSMDPGPRSRSPGTTAAPSCCLLSECRAVPRSTGNAFQLSQNLDGCGHLPWVPACAGTSGERGQDAPHTPLIPVPRLHEDRLQRESRNRVSTAAASCPLSFRHSGTARISAFTRVFDAACAGPGIQKQLRPDIWIPGSLAYARAPE